MKLRYLSNERLIAEFKRVVVRERWAIANVIEYIVEIDRRQLYLDKACSSMTAFCIERMGYSQDAAANRVGVARVVQQYPIALDMLRRGELTMTNIRTVATTLTRENHKERLSAIVGKTKLEVQELVAGWAPKPDVPTSIKDITPPPPPDLLLRMQAAPASRVEQPSAAELYTAQSVEPPRPAPLPKPLSPGRYKVEFTADKEEQELLMKARDILRHSIPDGDIKKILMKGLRDLVAKTEARKFGKLKRPKRTKQAAELPLDAPAPATTLPPAEPAVTYSREPTREMLREMAERSDCQCEYTDEDDNRCQSKAWLEKDHMDGFAKVQKTEGARMRFLCRRHNQGRNTGHDDLARSGTSKPVQLSLEGTRPSTSDPSEVKEPRVAYRVGPSPTRSGTNEPLPTPAPLLDNHVRELRVVYRVRPSPTRSGTSEAA